MTTVHWDAAAGVLTVPADAMEELGEPDELFLAARADGLTIRGVVAGLEALDGVRLATMRDGGDLLDADPIQLPVSPEQARRLRLPPQAQPYRAWVAADDEDEPVLYAVPGDVLTGDDAGQVQLGLAVHARDLVILETLALQHAVRVTDILTAFVQDLAGYYAGSLEERYARSGGSDEMLLADEWFQRNVDPTGSWLEDHDGPVFLRGCHQYEDSGEE